MAVQYDVAVKFSLQDSISAGLAKIKTGLTSVSSKAASIDNSKLKQVDKDVKDIGKSTDVTTAAFSKLKLMVAGLGVGAAFKTALESSMDFEHQMSIIQSVTFATTEEMKA
ncbi:MAG: hypothetical protein KAI17_09295, partial [Thiotrichaceae bacterium]|nr:hypothetical protein [Thiotrichaceae bacterium]